ncbi:MAG: hypothetical protein ACJAVI_003488 [Candidatus Azotimanducaceae bacterium]|jgi:hypothetical protein
MSGTYESLRLNGEENNVDRLGTFVAWLVANNLLASDLEKRAGSSVARLRMQDLNGADFLATVMHGEFKVEHLAESARKFVEDYFVSGTYEADFNSCAYNSTEYTSLEHNGENVWLLYDEVAPKISKAFHQFNNPPSPPKSKAKTALAKILQFPSRKL